LLQIFLEKRSSIYRMRLTSRKSKQRRTRRKSSRSARLVKKSRRSMRGGERGETNSDFVLTQANPEDPKESGSYVPIRKDVAIKEGIIEAN